MIDYTPLWITIKTKGITKAKLSELCGISKVSLSTLGRKSVRTSTVESICSALGCGIADVCRWVPDGTVIERVPTRPARSDSGNKEGASENLEKETFSRVQKKDAPSVGKRPKSPEKYTYSQKEEAYCELEGKSFKPLAAYLTDHDVSFTALRDGTGLDVGTLVAFASGAKVPSYGEAGRIIRFLGCGLGDVCVYEKED